ncbi:SIS domain-containing protein [Paenarthrobacter sp. DKR-5]|uniref:SIS domain-containing protein n=1 Tax=Paenarthrobacter sp. DKR-5 TaxID=2835535 RepID=UPI001BDC10EF|nr:SIS domain-containing protein [Paenarthrobacter sp. DKR-5]MBT1003915.1 SIS domain-containing protein [Paenarthrobacter sp. DKR-5]
MSSTTSTDTDRQAGSEATAREIIQQPDVWREAADLVEAQRESIDSFLAPLLNRPDLRIILTGAGTSAFAGNVAAPSLAHQLHRRVDAVATTDIVSNPYECFAEDVPTLLVSFARSGNSPESTAATKLADEVLTDVHHLILTCDKKGDLFRDHQGRDNSLVLLMPERANDQGFAMTSSFTSMLLSCLLIFGGPNNEAINALAAAVARLLAQREPLEKLALNGYDRVVYLGSGPLAGLAQECALKLLELTAGKVVAYHDSSLGFRHGPKAVLTDKTLIIVLVSSDPYTRRYDLDILHELHAGIAADNTVAVSTVPLSGAGHLWLLPELAGLDDAFLAPAYVVTAQLLALSASLQLGLTPDNPFPSGDVNRVVQGVQIHPLEPAPAH